MSPSSRLALLAACGLCLPLASLHACSVYTEDLLVGGAGPGGGGGTTTSTGGGGSGAGGGPACSTPADCPGQDTDCSYRTCVAQSCGMADELAGTACTAGGGVVCDGTGSCVECVDEQQCQPGESCAAGHTCQPGLADDGAPCSSPAVCKSNLCVDGVCCAVLCDGACQSCAIGGSEGSCTDVPDGQDPDSECAGTDTCNGLGACRCGDSSQNGNETDVDCGGADCGPCGNGKGCLQNSDCVSNYCFSTCQSLPTCGNTQIDPGEDCDDGGTESFDGCSATCLNPTSHLIISEIVATPTAAEFIEIYNPTSASVSLDQMYLADLPSYYLVTQGPVATGNSDFVAHFPSGHTIAPGAFVVVSLETATDFNGAYGSMPDFDFAPGDNGAPAMTGDIGSSAGLTNTGEMVVLFRWNGASDLVTDVDYLVYGSTAQGMDKTGVTVGTSTYQPDTPTAGQVAAPKEDTSGQSLHRCDTAESTETASGGNGTSGHDETSESGAAAFKNNATPSPGAAPQLGFCP